MTKRGDGFVVRGGSFVMEGGGTNTRIIGWIMDVFIIVMCCRYQMFLQLKLNVLSGRLRCSDDVAAELSALALQCQSVSPSVCLSVVCPFVS